MLAVRNKPLSGSGRLAPPGDGVALLWFGETASTMAECPAATMRRAFSARQHKRVGHGRRVTVLTELVGLADPKQRFSLDVGAHDDRAWHRANRRRQFARQL